MKFIVIDIQGFFNPPRFVVKEVAITDGTKSECFLVKSLNQNLTFAEKREVRFLENFHHGLKFNDGHVNLDECINILKERIRNCDLVYVRGHQKEYFLQCIVNESERNKISNIEHKTPAFTKQEPTCFNHKLEKCMCALQNVWDLHDHIISLLPNN